MSKFVAPGRLVIQDENLGLQNPKKAVSNAKSKISKTDGKKAGSKIGGRKALIDITNKKSIQPEASSRKKNLPKEEINIKEEMCLHDHSKCIEAQKAALSYFNLESVLPPDDGIPMLEQIKVPGSPRCYPEPVELSMAEFSDWFDIPMQRKSPPSPLSCDSPPSPLAWEKEVVEFVLKPEENDA